MLQKSWHHEVTKSHVTLFHRLQRLHRITRHTNIERHSHQLSFTQISPSRSRFVHQKTFLPSTSHTVSYKEIVKQSTKSQDELTIEGLIWHHCIAASTTWSNSPNAYNCECFREKKEKKNPIRGTSFAKECEPSYVLIKCLFLACALNNLRQWCHCNLLQGPSKLTHGICKVQSRTICTTKQLLLHSLIKPNIVSLWDFTLCRWHPALKHNLQNDHRNKLWSGFHYNSRLCVVSLCDLRLIATVHYILSLTQLKV